LAKEPNPPAPFPAREGGELLFLFRGGGGGSEGAVNSPLRFGEGLGEG